MDYMGALEEFHGTMGSQFIEEQDDFGRHALIAIRRRLIKEEYKETVDALNDAFADKGDLAHVAKELADLLYVVFGTALAFRIPMDDVFSLVHESNMAKLGKDGKPTENEWGKYVKPNGWVSPEPRIRNLLEGR